MQKNLSKSNVRDASMNAVKMVSKVRKDKYVSINWFHHLGFNNVRFILEVGLSLANTLRRQLILPTHLRMRTCLDPGLCSLSSCEFRKDSFWCPLGHLFDEKHLQSAGGAQLKNQAALDNVLADSKSVTGLFERMYDKNSLFFDEIPGKIKSGLIDNQFKSSKRQAVKYYNYHLGCELTWIFPQTMNWDSNKEADKSKKIYGLAEELGSEEAKTLVLEGTPHYIGLTPFVWSTEAAQINQERLWDQHIIYHTEITTYARIIGKFLKGRTRAGTYLCVHMRRGDFATLGWLGEAANLDAVRLHIESTLVGQEAFYIATDEKDEDILDSFRAIGGFTWNDVLKANAIDDTEFPILKHMIGFEDYVGLIEQMICAEARTFLGSKCSSFTGRILNLRKVLVGDTEWNPLAHMQ